MIRAFRACREILYVDRQNLTMRMGVRRFTRLANGFSKKIKNRLYMLPLYVCRYSFLRIHKSLKVTPAMAAGIDYRLRDIEWIVGLVDARAPALKRPSPTHGTRCRRRNDPCGAPA